MKQPNQPIFNTFKNLFPKNTLYLQAIGTGNSPLGVVKQSIVERDRFEKEQSKEADHVWSVFDKDDADSVPSTVDKFKEALELASREKIKLAYSNETFELWLLLYFQKVDPKSPIPRATVYEKLGEHIKALNLVPPVVYTKKKIPKDEREKGYGKPIYTNSGKIASGGGFETWQPD